MKPELRCRVGDLPELAARYTEDTELKGLRQEILERGYMKNDELRPPRT